MALQWVDKPRRAGRVRRAFVVAGAVVGVAVGSVLAVWLMVHARPDGNDRAVRFQVTRGMALDGLVERLEQVGMAPHPTVMKMYFRVRGLMEELQAGVYELPADANAPELLTVFRGAPRFDGVELMLRPGLTFWESAEAIAKVGIGTVDQLRALGADFDFARQHVGARLLGPRRAPRPDGVAQTYLDGFIAPDTFFVKTDTSVRKLLIRLVGQFHTVWRPLAKRYEADRLALRQRYGLTDRQLIIMASLVEREMADRSEGPRIAGVFYNRLERSMKLQTDPTLIYRPDRVGLKPTPDHRRDASNPYNTYAHRGLPPGPICSPSKHALLSALRPERHDFLYFVASGGGRHVFAKTYEAHKRNVKRYLRR